MYTLSPSSMDANGVIMLENVLPTSGWPGFAFQRINIKANTANLRIDLLGAIFELHNDDV